MMCLSGAGQQHQIISSIFNSSSQLSSSFKSNVTSNESGKLRHFNQSLSEETRDNTTYHDNHTKPPKSQKPLDNNSWSKKSSVNTT